jgi:F-type H+-transporting ATPase subunit delta
MPLLTEPSNTTRVYARAFFDLAFAQGGRAAVESLSGELDEVVELTRSNAKFGELLSHPTVTSDVRAKSIDRIFKGRVSDLTLRCLHVLNAKGRINALPAVAASLDDVAQQKFGRVEVDVFTAQPVAAGELDGLRTRLGASLGKDVVVHPYTDPKMIGGIKLKIGDQLVDASIESRLRRMRDKLNTSGGAALRSRIGRTLDG